MRALIQRVTNATVTNLELADGSADSASSVSPSELSDGSRGRSSASIGPGYVILLGVGHEDTEADAEKLWNKILKLRIFDDESSKTNLSLRDVNGSVMVVSQFTLFASCKKGNRPSFTDAGAPDQADRLYRFFIDLVRADGIPVEHGWFGAHMQVALVNDGPFTIWLDTAAL